MLKVLKVSGTSLYPDYKDGDFVIILAVPVFFRPYAPGSVVVFTDRVYGKLIKRVQVVDYRAGRLFVTGDHAESLDSRQLGWVAATAIEGKVILHIRAKR